MAEFYLNLGLKIIRIYKFIELYPQNCCETLANEIVNSGREADLNKSKAVIALTNKLTGNLLKMRQKPGKVSSLYFSTLMVASRLIKRANLFATVTVNDLIFMFSKCPINFYRQNVS